MSRNNVNKLGTNRKMDHEKWSEIKMDHEVVLKRKNWTESPHSEEHSLKHVHDMNEPKLKWTLKWTNMRRTNGVVSESV